MSKKKCTDNGPNKKTKKSEPIRILSWNVHGFSNPIGPVTRSVSARIQNPPMYVTYLQDFDVITLQETWLKENPFMELMPDYQWLSIAARDPEGRRGRNKGGLIIGWRRSIQSRNIRSELVGNSEWGSVELLLNGEWVQVVGIYRHYTTKFSGLSIPFNQTLPILLMGDLNTRMDNRQSSPDISRESRDLVWSSTSSAFLKLLRLNGLYVLNGSVPGDIPGDFTRIALRRNVIVKSCIDYAAMNSSMHRLIKEMRVDNTRRESDHRPLIVTLVTEEDDDQEEEEKEKEDREREIEKAKQRERQLEIEKKQELERMEKKAREEKEERECKKRENEQRIEREAKAREEEEADKQYYLEMALMEEYENNKQTFGDTVVVLGLGAAVCVVASVVSPPTAIVIGAVKFFSYLICSLV